MEDKDLQALLNKLTALEENEMQLFRMMLDMQDGAILTAETDMMLAKLLANEDLLIIEDEDRVFMPEDIRRAYRDNWTDELTLRWRKRNWMYKCIEAGKYLYGVMTWDVLKELFALRYPSADMGEVKELFGSTPAFFQWMNERDGKLVLNGFERDDYYKYLESIQEDIPFYIPDRDEVEELYNRGSLISREAHARLRDFIAETYDCGADAAELRIHDLYEEINNRARMADIADRFAAGGDDSGMNWAFPSDEAHVKFIELLMDMSRECRTRDNRGHDWFEMTGIMASKNRQAGTAGKQTPVRRVKIGRNEPCPCGSGKKYKNCCGR